MSKYSSKDVVLLIDGYNVLGEITELTYAVEALTEESTGLGDVWEEHEYTGIQRSEITQNGFYNDDSLSVNEAFNEKQGDDRVLCFGFEGNTAGKSFTGFAGTLQTRFDRIASVNSLHKANVTYLGDGQAGEGKILLALSGKTADGDTEASPVNNGAQSTGGAYLFLQVTDLDLDGYDDLTVYVRSSADGITWSTLDTFTAVTAAPTAERRLKTGTIPKYLAVSWEFIGLGSDPSATLFVGAVRL